MKNEQNQQLANPPSARQISKSRRSSFIAVNRIQKIRDKRMVYPESTLSKIVFITNMEGNGFQRENIYLYDVPAHIDLQGMISNINHICFNQWRTSFQILQTEPLHRYDFFQRIIGSLALIVMILFVYFIIMQEVAQTEILAYIFLVLIGFGCIGSLLLMKQKRVQVNKDLDMIRAIKSELIKLNESEITQFSENARFTWTCHKDCLWIACQFH